TVNPLPQEYITGISILDSPAPNHPMAEFHGVKLRGDLGIPLDDSYNPWRGLDAVALLSGTVEDPLILDVGKAEFDAPDGFRPGNEPNWGGPANNTLPAGWAPVHLIEMAAGFDDTETN